MRKKRYRVWLSIEEVEGDGTFDPRLVEQIELAAFETIEEALTYRHHLARRCSLGIADRSSAIRRMRTSETHRVGD